MRKYRVPIINLIHIFNPIIHLLNNCKSSVITANSSVFTNNSSFTYVLCVEIYKIMLRNVI